MMPAGDLHWECTDRASGDDLGVVDAGLHLHNITVADLDAVRPLACLLRDAGATVVGGLRARQWGAAVEAQQLRVDAPRRRQGIGARLMRILEQAAIERGARIIYLDTFTFQAPQFYRRCGFEVAARIDGFPDGIASYAMVKPLAGAAARR